MYASIVSRVVSGLGHNTTSNRSLGINRVTHPKKLDKGKLPMDLDGFTIVKNKRGPDKGKARSFSSGYTSFNMFDALQHAGD